MWTPDKKFQGKGFSTPPPWRSRRSSPILIPATENNWRSHTPPEADFHVVHKVPAGDSPYVRAKHVQLVDKDPSRAISMFWAAINSGDRVDSALKDMAVVMKQLNRSDEAIEAIKSFRHLCPLESQESIDNLLLELYKRSGRIQEQIELLQVKLKHIEEGIAFGGRRSKIARSQGKKIQISIEQDYSRLLGNLAWAYLQLDNYKLAEEFYRKALSLEPDKNKQCNLAICLMYTNRMTEAKFLLHTVRSSCEYRQLDESYAKSYERAVQVMDELELEKKSSKDTQTPFSSLLHINDESKQATLQSSPQAFCGNHMTEGSYSGSFPKVPFTQPRRCAWSSNNRGQRSACEREDGVGACNRRLLFEQPLIAKNALLGNRIIDAHELPASSDEVAMVARDTSEWLPPYTVGDWRGGRLAEDHTVEATHELQSQSKLAQGNIEEVQDIPVPKSKKSWADFVEEDEQELFSELANFPVIRDEFGDENADINIICGTPMQTYHSENVSLNLKDGYNTQPKKPDSSVNQVVKRSLCFDPQLKLEGEQSFCSLPLEKKTIKFGGFNSGLVKENSVTSIRRNRLQVFCDITLQSDSPRP